MTMRFDYIARMKRAKERNLKPALYVEAESSDGLMSLFVWAGFFALQAQNDKKTANGGELRKIAKLSATTLACAPEDKISVVGSRGIHGVKRR